MPPREQKKLSQRAREWNRRRGYDKKAENYQQSQAEETAGYELGGSFRPIPFTVYPTHTICPPRPRTIAAGYDRKARTMRIRFRPGADSKSPGGAVYDYYDITPAEWKAIKKTVSTGRFINNQLDGKSYSKLYGPR